MHPLLGLERVIQAAHHLLRADLDDLKAIRKAQGGTVNDVLLNVVTGALREWLLSRGEPVVVGTSIRALVPVSMQDEEADTGNRVSSYLVDLPVGEPNPRVRLTRLSYAMRGIAQHGQSVGADSLNGGTGADSLSGGVGTDMFAFRDVDVVTERLVAAIGATSGH